VFPAGETVVLVSRRVAGRDAYGNDVYEDTHVEVSGCAVWPGFAIQGADTSMEATGLRQTTVTGLTVFMPADVVVRSTDRVMLRGRTWEVDAEPAVWRSPFTGRVPGQQIVLKEVLG